MASTTDSPAQRSARALRRANADAKRDRRRGVAKVVNQVGEQRHAARGDEHQDLRRCRKRQHNERKRTCLRDYGHLFDEFDPAVREPAEAMIRAARDGLVPLSYFAGRRVTQSHP